MTDAAETVIKLGSESVHVKRQKSWVSFERFHTFCPDAAVSWVSLKLKQDHLGLVIWQNKH